MKLPVGAFGGHLLASLVLISVLIVLGTVGYMALESLDLIEAFYHTVISISTVGYNDIATKSATRIFTVLLILSGVFAFYYFSGSIAATLVSGKLFEVLKLRRIEEELSRITDHVILCGYGQVGSLIAEKLGNVVVVEKEDARFSRLVERKFLAVRGDSTHPQTLKKAGVERARAVIVALDSDPEAVYTILTIMELNPGISVYARANETISVNKMKKAGAHYVICLPEVGSRDILNALEGREGCMGDVDGRLE